MPSWLSRFLLAPDEPRIRRWPLKLIALLLIGALGSGLWDSLLKPIFRMIGYWILDLASLGLQSYRSDIYKQISAGSLSGFDREVLLLVMTLYFALWVAIPGALFILKWQLDGAYADLKRETEGPDRLLPAAAESPEEFLREVGRAGRYTRFTRLSAYVFACIATISIAVETVNFAKLIVINSAVVHYEQMLKISAPFMTESDRRQTESQFSQVASRTDYQKVVDGLERIAKDHGQRVPDFRPW